MNEKLKAQLDSAIRSIETRKQSEKIIVLAMLIAGLVLGYLSMAYDPLSTVITRIESQIENLERQIVAQQSTYATMVAASQQDPSRFANDRLTAITRELQTLDGEINNLAGDLISPAQMTQILTSVLGNYTGLQLVRFQNKPAAPLRIGLSANDPIATTVVNESMNGQVFEHGLQLEFQGDFFTTLKYLRFLEEISRSFFWDSITFQQLEWPRARVTLEIHTLSTDAGFIGV